MTPDEIKLNHRFFEVAGSLMCGLLFGLLLWRIEVGRGDSYYSPVYADLVWNLLLSTSCYLSAFYVLDRRAEEQLWESRPNWALISLCGTTLLCFVGLGPYFTRSGGYRTIRLDEQVIAFCVVLAILNILMVMAMGAAWGLGAMVRSLRRGICFQRVVP